LQDERKDKQGKMAVGARHTRKQEIAALLKLVLRKATNSKSCYIIFFLIYIFY
jgi:hypothetical protein